MPKSKFKRACVATTAVPPPESVELPGFNIRLAGHIAPHVLYRHDDFTRYIYQVTHLGKDVGRICIFQDTRDRASPLRSKSQINAYRKRQWWDGMRLDGSRSSHHIDDAESAEDAIVQVVKKIVRNPLDEHEFKVMSPVS